MISGERKFHIDPPGYSSERKSADPGRMLMAGYVDTTEPDRLSRLTGGILYDFKIGKRFSASGWDVEYFNLESLPRYAKMLKFPAAEIISRRSKSKFDVLVTDLGSSSLTLALQRKERRQGRFTVLICHHFRGNLEKTPVKRLLYRWTEKRIVREADFVVANSSLTVRKLKEFGRSDKDVLLAQPGLNVRLARKPRFRENPTRLLLVGNVESRKGVVEAVKALAYSGIKGAELRIAGERYFEQGYLGKVKDCIDELGLADRVNLLGRLTDEELRSEYERADAFILPSFWEGYGMAIAEAMACGLPVISTTAGAIPDMVTDGVSGLLGVPGDWRATGTDIRRIFSEPDLRKYLAVQALDAAARFPSWDDTTRKVLEAIEKRTGISGGNNSDLKN